MSEHEIQAAVIDWARLQASSYPCLDWLHAIPNGAKLPWRKNSKGQRYSPEAMKLKAEGLTPGICDLFLPFPARGFHGFYLETKAPGKLEEVRQGQKEFMEYCESVGFYCLVYDDIDAGIEALKWYVGIG